MDEMKYAFTTKEGYYIMDENALIDVLTPLTFKEVEDMLTGQRYMRMVLSISESREEDEESKAEFKEVGEKLDNFIEYLKSYMDNWTGDKPYVEKELELH